MSRQQGGGQCVETVAGIPGGSADPATDTVRTSWIPCGGVSYGGHHPVVHRRHQVIQREHTGQ